MTDNSAYAGARAPEYYRHTISSSPDGYVSDLTTVTAARIDVRRPDGAKVSWTATVHSASATELELRHEFAVDGADVALEGTYRVQPWIQTSAGWFPCSVDSFRVEAL